MKRFMTTLMLLATLAPAAGFANDNNPNNPGRQTVSGNLGGGGADFDLSDYVLGRGDFAPNPGNGPVQAHPNDVLPEDLIDEICEDGDVIIIFGDDGSIEDWDCDFG